MKTTLFSLGLMALMLACIQGKTTQKTTATTALNTLSKEEQKAGFELLFNGKDFTNWHCYHRDSVKWEIVEGVLHTKGGNGDLVSDREVENFELTFDWKAAKAGNSGVFYMVQDKPDIPETYYSGIEYQVIDPENWPDKLHEEQKPGAVYDLYAPLVKAEKAVGEWNTGKIVVSNNNHIEHYVNGQKTADYTWNSDDYKQHLAASKFKDWPFAKVKKGHLALQDHGQEVWFRNIKLKTME